MIAKCLDGREVEVIKYKNIYYNTINFHLPYCTYKKTKKPVKKGLEYAHYIIEGEMYETCLTNNLDVIARPSMKRYRLKGYRMVKKYKQLSIFDMEEEE